MAEHKLRQSQRRSSGVESNDHWYGVYPALVTAVGDPEGQGRVKVTLPWAPDAEGHGYEAWARLSTLMAGKDQGTWFLPDPGSEVLVAFEGGDPRRPYVLGGLWNGQDAPPSGADGPANNVKLIRSRSGIQITLDDQQGHERFTVEMPGGQKLELISYGDKGPGAVLITDNIGNTIHLGFSGIEITAASDVKLVASRVNLSAGSVVVDCGEARFSGVVKCDTLITNSVISNSYTPGVGNVW